MNIHIDEMQERVNAYYRRREILPDTVGPHIIHLTQKMGALADAFIEDHGKMPDAVSEIIIVSLFILTILKQPASDVLKEKLQIMEQPQNWSRVV